MKWITGVYVLMKFIVQSFLLLHANSVSASSLTKMSRMKDRLLNIETLS